MSGGKGRREVKKKHVSRRTNMGTDKRQDAKNKMQIKERAKGGIVARGNVQEAWGRAKGR